MAAPALLFPPLSPRRGMAPRSPPGGEWAPDGAPAWWPPVTRAGLVWWEAYRPGGGGGGWAGSTRGHCPPNGRRRGYPPTGHSLPRRRSGGAGRARAGALTDTHARRAQARVAADVVWGLCAAQRAAAVVPLASTRRCRPASGPLRQPVVDSTPRGDGCPPNGVAVQGQEFAHTAGRVGPPQRRRPPPRGVLHTARLWGGFQQFLFAVQAPARGGREVLMEAGAARPRDAVKARTQTVA